MIDQSFTVVNFRKIFDYENRKGCYLEGRYFPTIEAVTRRLKTCASDFKKLNKEKSNISPEEYEIKKSELNDIKKHLEEEKERLLTDELESLCKKININGYNIELIKVDAPQGKAVYKIDKNNSLAYFIIKQIQYSLKKLYKVKQSSRYHIVCQLRGILDNDFPKYIIRTDIEEFYESISQERLLKKIDKDYLLSLSSKKTIHNIVSKYNDLSGKSIGIPRGIGVSAYLSELYMREFDEAVKKHPDIIYYARYVDDIIAIYAPKPDSDTSQLLPEIRKEAGRLGLTLNETNGKTIEVNLTTVRNADFEYLGYHFCVQGKTAAIKISRNKIKRYRKRLELAFDSYKKQNPTEKIARKTLINRVRFITGNTRLSNNKDNALVGIYFSNSLITDSSCLDGLDKFLKHQIDNATHLPCTVKERLKKMTFKSGWEQKLFYKFSAKELQNIVRVWKNVT